MLQLLTIIGIYIFLIMMCFLTQPQKILLTPQFGFIVFFLPGLMYAVFFVDKWNLHLSGETMLVLIGGASTFFLVSVGIQELYKNTHKGIMKYNARKESCDYEIKVSRYKVYFLTGFNIFVLIWSFAYLLGRFGLNVSVAINAYRIAYVLGEDEASMGTMLANARFISFTLGFLWSYLLMHGIVYGYKKNRILYTTNLIIAIITDLLSGARGDSLLLIVASVIMLYLIDENKNNWSSKLKVKAIIKTIGVFALILVTYKATGNLLGRGEESSNVDFIAKYLSAPIKNLDTFILNGEKNVKLPEWLTLRTFFTRLSQYTHNLDLVSLTRYSYGGYRGFMSVNGFNLGNVYTSYFAYVHDLGIKGAFIFPAIMAFIEQILFWKVIKDGQKRKENKINISFIVYSFTYVTVILSFFSDRFFDYIINFAFIKRLLILWVLIFFLEKVKFCVSGNQRRYSVKI